MITKRTALVLVVLQAILIAGGIALVVFLLREGARSVEKHIMPAGYVGWVRVTYDVAEAEPLPIEGGARVFRYRADGRLHTSSEPARGLARREYYYDEGGTLRPLRWTLLERTGHVWGPYDATVTVEQDATLRRREVSGFFVGSWDDYQEDRAPLGHPEDDRETMSGTD